MHSIAVIIRFVSWVLLLHKKMNPIVVILKPRLSKPDNNAMHA